ncbi:hypothetical protein L2E82_10248 [Cichorium intybus]|uniref:Uncharacterized protein n=1 Tax=Cichorium intybus TaxID=13427 RepID=A0ACB9GA21_CICIN|nr:hypothetical protein L2E82_10248 [Cichorium intybus]
MVNTERIPTGAPEIEADRVLNAEDEAASRERQENDNININENENININEKFSGFKTMEPVNVCAPVENLMALGCFGPFASNMSFSAQRTCVDSLNDSRPQPKKTKRRRADREGRSYSPFDYQATNSRSDSIDLNHNPRRSSLGNS